MITFEDLISDTTNDILLHHFDDYVNEYEKFFVLKQLKKYSTFAVFKLFKNCNLQYSYNEKIIIFKSIIEQLFVLMHALVIENINFKYHKVLLEQYINDVLIYILQNPYYNFRNNNFYQYIRQILRKNLRYINQFSNNDRHLSEQIFFKLEKYLYTFKFKNFLDSNKFRVNKNIIIFRLGSNILKNNTYWENNLLWDRLEIIANNLFFDLGFLIIKFNAKYNLDIKDNEYEIQIHNQIVSKGTFQYDSEESINYMFNQLENALIDNVHKILSVRDTYRYLEYVKKEYSKKIVKQLLKELDINDIRTILCNLIQQRISITNISYIVESLAKFARLDKDVDSLTQKLKGILTETF